MEIVLVGKATEAILLILPLHLINLFLQIGDFLLFSILLPETARINLYIIPWLRKSIGSIRFFGVFGLRQMLWEIVEKLVVLGFVLILNSCSLSLRVLHPKDNNFCRKICDSAAMWRGQREAIQCRADEFQSCSKRKVSWLLSGAHQLLRCFLVRAPTMLAVSIPPSLAVHSLLLSKQSSSKEV